MPLDNDPVHAISRMFANSVTKECFESLVKLLNWSWSHFKVTLNAVKEKVDGWFFKQKKNINYKQKSTENQAKE